MKIIKILFVLIILVGLAAGLYFKVLKKEKKEYSLAKVSRATIIQEVSESGKLAAGEEINLSFKSSERLTEMAVVMGSQVSRGQKIAQLDISNLLIQLNETTAAYQATKAKVNKLLAGASTEEISVTEASVASAETSFRAAQQSLEGVNSVAKSDLANVYDDAPGILSDAYLKASNAFYAVRSTYLTYFLKSEQTAISVKDSHDRIEIEKALIKSYLDAVTNNASETNIDRSLSGAKTSLDKISAALVTTRQACGEPLYRDVVSSTDKTALDTQCLNINTVITSVMTTRQLISSTRTNNEYKINNAESEIAKAEAALAKAKQELIKLKMPARQEDIDLAMAEVDQAKARQEEAELQISQATLLSPTNGQITAIHKQAGEMVQPGEAIVSLLSLNPFQVKVDIYEEDIVKVKPGNAAEIKLTAFPNRKFAGIVVSIEPAGRVIDDVVYYKVTIDFESAPEGLRPEMTADVTIKTATRENVLVVPEKAVKKKDGQTLVIVKKGSALEEKEIELGLRGNDYLVEVISGLNEGEEVVVNY